MAGGGAPGFGERAAGPGRCGGSVVHDAAHRVGGGAGGREEEVGEAGIRLGLVAAPVEKRGGQSRGDAPAEGQRRRGVARKPTSSERRLAATVTGAVSAG